MLQYGFKLYISVHPVASELGFPICCLLPAMHAISECSSISSFSHTGKITAFQTLRNKLDEWTDMRSPLLNSPHSLESPSVVTLIQYVYFFMMRINQVQM